VEETVGNGSLSTYVLAAIALLIPVVGFIMTLSHARAGDSRHEQRWRKSHGLAFWVLIPGVAGVILLMGFSAMLPRQFTIVGILLLALGAGLSFVMKKRHEDRRH
jgi:hypothetical protein